jgi:bacitracin transport system ATP-binding protein
LSEILKTENLSKSFAKFKAVDEVNLSIRKGEIYGFLGQNGAGKTTTLRMIVGLVKPTSGSIRLYGEKQTKQGLLQRIGSMIETPGLYKNLTVTENLSIHCKLIGLKDPGAIERCLYVVGLWEARNKLVRKLSLGMKQRLAIGRSLIHQPDFLILDEPTNGLDPVGIREIRELLIQLSCQQNITMLISSHILSEIEQIATHIGIIHNGKILRECGIEVIRSRTNGYLELKISQETKALFILEEHFGIKKYRLTEPGTVRVYERIDESANIIRTLVQQEVEVFEAVKRRDSIEDYFINTITGKEEPFYV